jgi:hypothetical protein
MTELKLGMREDTRQCGVPSAHFCQFFVAIELIFIQSLWNLRSLGHPIRHKRRKFVQVSQEAVIRFVCELESQERERVETTRHTTKANKSSIAKE